jgi:hypothetical protein
LLGKSTFLFMWPYTKKGVKLKLLKVKYSPDFEKWIISTGSLLDQGCLMTATGVSQQTGPQVASYTPFCVEHWKHRNKTLCSPIATQKVYIHPCRSP